MVLGYTISQPRERPYCVPWEGGRDSHTTFCLHAMGGYATPQFVDKQEGGRSCRLSRTEFVGNGVLTLVSYRSNTVSFLALVCLVYVHLASLGEILPGKQLDPFIPDDPSIHPILDSR